MPRTKNTPDLDKALSQAINQMSALQAQIDKIQAAKQAAAATLQAQIESQTKDIADRTAALELLKAQLREIQNGGESKVRGKPGPKPGAKAAKVTAASKTAEEAPIRRKPGPKPGLKKASPKATPKVKAPRAVPKKTPKGPSAVAEGRRAVARGDRPPMKEAVARVMGKATMGAGEVVEALRAKNWLPNTSPEKTQQYVSFVLSSTKEIFERVERGSYRVREGATFVHRTRAPKAKAATPKAAPAKKDTTKDIAEPRHSASHNGADIHADALANPFT